MKLRFRYIPFIVFTIIPWKSNTANGKEIISLSPDHDYTTSQTATIHSVDSTTKKRLLFQKTARMKNPDMTGCDSATIYISSSAKLFHYGKYLVSLFTGNDGIETVKVYADSSQILPDTISLPSQAIPLCELSDPGLWFLGIKGDFIFIRRSTGVDPAGLTVINLSSKDTVFETFYSDTISVDSNYSVIYFGPSDEKATKENYPEYDKIIKDGLTPAIEDDESFNLITRITILLGHKRCTVYQ